MPVQWFVNRSGEQIGPLSSSQLKQLAQEGGIAPTDLIWKAGLESWVPAVRVGGLFFGPPPLPPVDAIAVHPLRLRPVVLPQPEQLSDEIRQLICDEMNRLYEESPLAQSPQVEPKPQQSKRRRRRRRHSEDDFDGGGGGGGFGGLFGAIAGAMAKGVGDSFADELGGLKPK